MKLLSLNNSVDINSPISITSTIFMSLSGWVVFMGMPIILGTLADLRGYGDAEIGYLASAELGGMFLASLFVAATVNRLNRRMAAVAGLLVSLVINIMAGAVTDYWFFMMLRIIAGFGSGICYSIAVANLAGTRNKARNYSFMIFTLVACNALELYFLPDIAAAFGVAGIFYVFAALNLISLFFVRNVAASCTLKKAETAAPVVSVVSPIYSWLCIAAVVCFYICISSFWAYIERLGVTQGFTSDFIATTLSLTTLFSLAGCYFAYRVSKVMGQSLPLVLTLLIISITIFCMAFMPSQAVYFAGLLIYQLLWNSIDIYQLGTLSNIDPTGRYVALVSGASGLGQMIGPAGAGVTISLGYGVQAALMFAGTASLIAMGIYLIVHIGLMRNGRYDPVTDSEETRALI